MNNIFLCGFMGCGKSTVGQRLSQILSMDFVDMDTYIEKIAGKTVTEIFKTSGEAKFREYEYRAVKELAAKNSMVIATGGGAVLSDKNVKAMKSGGIIVLIDVPLGIIAQRLEGDTTRPLLLRPDKADAMRSLYEKRMPFYRKAADITVINNNNSSTSLIANKIACTPQIKALHKSQKPLD